MSHHALIRIVAGALLGTALLLWLTGVTIDPIGFGGTAASMAAGFGAAVLQRAKPDGVVRRLAVTVEIVSAMALIALCGTVATYCLARVSSGYVDDWLARADHALGFDWLGLYDYTRRHGLVRYLGQTAYGSILWQPMLIVAALVLRGDEAAARRFAGALALALLCTVALFPFFPARSALLHYVGAHGAYRPMTSTLHVAAIELLRTAPHAAVPLATAVGLVTFPSFHAVSAVLFVWAAWPARWLRLPILVLDLAMLASTPVEGTHYLVDIIAGVALALGVIGIVRAVSRRGRSARPAAETGPRFAGPIAA